MMGDKTLREIKDQLGDALLKAKRNPIDQLERELRHLERQPKRDQRAIENVKQMRDALARLIEVPQSSQRRKRAKSRSGRPRTIR